MSCRRFLIYELMCGLNGSLDGFESNIFQMLPTWVARNKLSLVVLYLHDKSVIQRAHLYHNKCNHPSRHSMQFEYT